MMLVLLAGCGTDCASFDDTVILDPDGVLDDAAVDALYGAKDAFAAAVGVEGVCVDTVLVAASLEKAGYAIGGFYSRDDQRIAVSAAYDWDLGRILTHELCHALDDQLGLSGSHPELFSDAWGEEGFEEDLYGTPELRESERFAELCELGPRHPALTTALEQLGLASTGDQLLRDWVYPRFDDVPVAVGPALVRGETVRLALTEKGERVRTWAATGGHLMIDAEGGAPLGRRLFEVDPAGPALTAEARLPLARGQVALVLGIGDTDPLLQIDWGTPAARLFQWRDGDPAPVDGPFAALAGDPDTSFTVDGDRAWWQTWGDGQPVQTGLLSTGETGPYEASGELPLVPPLLRVPEGPASFAYQAWPPWQEWYVFGVDDLPRLSVPNGVRPFGTLADGTVVAWVDWRTNVGSWCMAPAFRSPDGAWWVPEDTACGSVAPSVIGGALYEALVDDDELVLTRLTGG